MSSAAKDLVAKMQRDQVEANPEDFHVKLFVFKTRRRLLYGAMLVAFCILLSLVMQAARNHVPWMIMSLPIILCGLMMTLVPPTEEWAYKPWQSSPRQYEKHIHSRR